MRSNPYCAFKSVPVYCLEYFKKEPKDMSGEGAGNCKLFVRKGMFAARSPGRSTTMILGVLDGEFLAFPQDETMYYVCLQDDLRGNLALTVISHLMPLVSSRAEMDAAVKQEGVNATILVREAYSHRLQKRVTLLLMTTEIEAQSLSDESLHGVLVTAGEVTSSLNFRIIEIRDASEEFKGKRADQILLAM